MNRKKLVILVCMLLMVATPGIAAQSIITNQQNLTLLNEPIKIEPLPVKKVREIPVPWQFWEEFPQEGVLDVIVLPQNSPGPVAIVRAYAVLSEELPLEDLTWENTMQMPLKMIDYPTEPYILFPGQQVEYFIQTTPLTKAVIVRYSAAWANASDVVVAHFVNEVVLGRGTILGSLSNFDVHNDYTEPINNFELELYGSIVPTDVLSWYDDPTLDPSLVPGKWSWDPILGSMVWIGPVWLYGWGVPPQINPQSYGIEMIWIDKAHPVKPCEWIHFGVHLKPGITLQGARAYLTIWTEGKDITVDNNKVIYNSLLLQFFEQHQNLFPILQKIIQRLGL